MVLKLVTQVNLPLLMEQFNLLLFIKEYMLDKQQIISNLEKILKQLIPFILEDIGREAIGEAEESMSCLGGFLGEARLLCFILIQEGH